MNGAIPDLAFEVPVALLLVFVDGQFRQPVALRLDLLGVRHALDAVDGPPRFGEVGLQFGLSSLATVLFEDAFLLAHPVQGDLATLELAVFRADLVERAEAFAQHALGPAHALPAHLHVGLRLRQPAFDILM